MPNMIIIEIKVKGAEAELRDLATRISAKMYFPFWQSYTDGQGKLDVSIETGEFYDGEQSINKLESFAHICELAGIDFLASDVTADVHMQIAVDSDSADPYVPIWPTTLATLSRLGLGLTIIASVGNSYAEIDGNEEEQDDIDRSEDIQRIVDILATETRSAVGRTASHTFVLVKSAVPVLPLSELHKVQISSLLAQRYAPPFYGSNGAAKSAASQHARAIWAMSNGYGDSEANNIAAFIASLRVAPEAERTT